MANLIATPLGAAEPHNDDQSVAALHRKIDLLTDQVLYLTARQRAFDDLKADVTPIVNDAYQVMVEELSQVDRDFTLEDLTDLGRKLLRNTRNISKMLD